MPPSGTPPPVTPEPAPRIVTGVPLADFFLMFEEARPVLGVPRKN